MPGMCQVLLGSKHKTVNKQKCPTSFRKIKQCRQKVPLRHFQYSDQRRPHLKEAVRARHKEVREESTRISGAIMFQAEA